MSQWVKLTSNVPVQPPCLREAFSIVNRIEVRGQFPPWCIGTMIFLFISNLLGIADIDHHRRPVHNLLVQFRNRAHYPALVVDSAYTYKFKFCLVAIRSKRVVKAIRIQINSYAIQI